jgi:hypothetical protein
LSIEFAGFERQNAPAKKPLAVADILQILPSATPRRGPDFLRVVIELRV